MTARRIPAFSLPELLVTLSVFSVAFTAVLSLFLFAARLTDSARVLDGGFLQIRLFQKKLALACRDCLEAAAEKDGILFRYPDGRAFLFNRTDSGFTVSETPGRSSRDFPFPNPRTLSLTLTGSGGRKAVILNASGADSRGRNYSVEQTHLLNYRKGGTHAVP